MQDRIVIGGEVSLTNVIDGELSLSVLVDGESGVFLPVYPDSYTGEYVITPLAAEEQILPCKHLVMQDDVTVLKVPYFETHNDSGTTVYIASTTTIL